jgi:death-on-curing protein
VTVFLEPEHLLEIARVGVGPGVAVRDPGLLAAAAGRPAAAFAGQEAYPGLQDKAAALLHSLVRNHGLVDGNKRLAWLATYVFLDLNGVVLDAPDDEAFDLVMRAAAGEVDVPAIAEALRSWCRP